MIRHHPRKVTMWNTMRITREARAFHFLIPSKVDGVRLLCFSTVTITTSTIIHKFISEYYQGKSRTRRVTSFRKGSFSSALLIVRNDLLTCDVPCWILFCLWLGLLSEGAACNNCFSKMTITKRLKNRPVGRLGFEFIVRSLWIWNRKIMDWVQKQNEKLSPSVQKIFTVLVTHKLFLQ